MVEWYNRPADTETRHEHVSRRSIWKAELWIITTVHKRFLVTLYYMIDQRHPNFPPGLSITPNAGLFANKAALEGGGEDAFGVEAQREAISRYGIAGRVW